MATRAATGAATTTLCRPVGETGLGGRPNADPRAQSGLSGVRARRHTAGSRATLIRTVAERFHEQHTRVAVGPADEDVMATEPAFTATDATASRQQGRMVLSWALVVLLLAYGVEQTLTTAAKLIG